MKATAEILLQAMRRYPTGVTIVSTRTAEGLPYGLTVNSFTSVSLDPLLVLVCLDNASSGIEHFLSADSFAVSLLAAGQQSVSIHFATSGTDRTDSGYVEGRLGLPLISGALATLECSTHERARAGDHTVLMGQVRHVHLDDNHPARSPLVYCGGNYFTLD